MPIRRRDRFFYPIDWRELSAVIRFGRAKGRCEGCGRPHGQAVFCLSDGRWWDVEAASWRDGSGRIVCTAVGIDTCSWPSERCGSCSLLRTATMIRPTMRRPISRHGASATTSSTIDQNTRGDDGSRCSAGRRSATCSMVPMIEAPANQHCMIDDQSRG